MSGCPTTLKRLTHRQLAQPLNDLVWGRFLRSSGCTVVGFASETGDLISKMRTVGIVLYPEQGKLPRLQRSHVGLASSHFTLRFLNEGLVI